MSVGERIAAGARHPRVAIVSGVCVRHDAISNAILEQRRALIAAGCEVTVFVQSSDCLEHPDVVLVPDAWALESDPQYATSDVVIAHFGVHHPLFSSLLLSHPGRCVVHFHNVTPPELLDHGTRTLAHDSLLQLSIADRADEIWAVSPHNAEVFRQWCDADPPPVLLMPLAVGAADHPSRRDPGPLGEGEPVVVLGVGRFVRPKGTSDLVEAAGLLPPELGPVHLVLAGSSRYSDPAEMARVRAGIDELPSHVTGQIELDVSDEELASRFGSADLFASASHHEGFCVPVVEALAAGCSVVVTDAGALPDTVGECGRIVASNAPIALAGALAEAIRERRRGEGPWDRGEIGDRWFERVREHLRPNTTASVDRRLVDAVRRLAGDGSRPDPDVVG